LTEYILRFLIGGFFVSIFAIVGDVVRPKSFAGLFSAAPSVALATLGIAWFQHGLKAVEVQATSMILGGIALACYSVTVCQILMRLRIGALPATISSIVVWLAIALGLHAMFLG